MVFIETFLILITLISNSSVNGFNNNEKCCPPQEIFSVKESSRCFISYNENSPGYYDARNEDWEIKYLKECFNVTSRKSSFNSTIASSITCIDLLRNKDLLDASFIHYCKQDSKNNGASLVMNMRKCCPIGQRYDTEIRECIEFTSGDSSILKVLNSFNVNVNFLSIIKGFPICKYAIIDYTISRDDQLSFYNDTIKISISSNTGSSKISINEDNSCLDFGSSQDTFVLRTCSNSEYCKQNACLRKCCLEDEAWINHRCRKISSFGSSHAHFHSVLKNVMETTLSNTTSLDVLNSTGYGLMIGQKFCNDSMYPIKPEENWSITSRGYIYVPKQDEYSLDEYCLEMVYGSKDYSDGLYPCLCFNNGYPEPNEEISPQRFTVNAVLELISCTFLLLTFLVYLCLPLLQNLHGKTLMCHLASLFIAFACHATITLSSLQDSIDDDFIINKPMCKPLGYTMAVAFLASFSWLSIMCFDIWWTFGGCSGAAYVSSRKKARKKRFFFYSCFAWGLPMIILIVMITIDRTQSIPEDLRPNIGVDSCWFDHHLSSYGEVIFFFGPITFLLIVNVIFFIMTLRNCNRVKADISKFMKTDTDSRRFKADKTKLILNIKLFVLMGISWIFEIISYVINHCAPDLSCRVELFYAFDVFNCLRGLIIFLLFVLKNKVYIALMHRLGRRKINAPINQKAVNLQEPYKMTKYTSCSTLMSSTVDRLNAQT
ncbi:probable G-protein coupled receptor Mth-like 10 [Cotesia glomerata]|uniref:G-protein coupled receptors family 2 profile 2 domain-containing protein n=1 Tax=Cotesia glomerata TaxID=32391 RepID=A0AAV7INJ8_COTGL|nr:probable G-protein coupled receptor Mth-like 10 [Cotesia glomerata]KAH0554195.1 hypothetical protein KQX54_008444 [Cotesia glomerata]